MLKSGGPNLPKRWVQVQRGNKCPHWRCQFVSAVVMHSNTSRVLVSLDQKVPAQSRCSSVESLLSHPPSLANLPPGASRFTFFRWHGAKHPLVR